ncbi:hypothetical protein [Deinococcus sp.]|uniref:hypothetical protein n=1 Tax=Deinococcus sp. TaxID=47478 RepID=UPI0025D7651A|nr:hypothetical protein [Deinococcus sp.]
MDNSTKPQPTQPQPTRPETAAQRSGSADVSYGANTNLSPADVSDPARQTGESSAPDPADGS